MNKSCFSVYVRKRYARIPIALVSSATLSPRSFLRSKKHFLNDEEFSARRDQTRNVHPPSFIPYRPQRDWYPFFISSAFNN